MKKPVLLLDCSLISLTRKKNSDKVNMLFKTI